MVQVYVSTSAAEEEEIDDFYNSLAEVVSNLSKSEITIIKGILTQKSEQAVLKRR